MCDHALYQHGKVVRGQLLRRYKRFLADVSLHEDPSKLEDGTQTDHTTVFFPNTGPLPGLLDRPNSPVVLSFHKATRRKYAHTVEMIQPEDGGCWVGVHSALANKMAQALLERKQVPSLLPYNTVSAEVKLDKHMSGSGHKRSLSVRRSKSGPASSRLDFQLQRDDGLTFVEVKSVTMAQCTLSGKKMALFPDTVSDRAQRHMEDLMKLVKMGHKAACMFIVQRSDCDAFAPCHAKDPEYGRLVQAAADEGVQVIAVALELSPEGGVTYARELPLDLGWSA